MFQSYFVFEDSDYARIINILRGAYQIRTADEVGEDELLGDLIAALEDRVPLISKDDELLLTDRVES